MKKYLLILTQRFSEYLAYRVNILLYIFQGFITPMLLLIVLSHAQSDQVSLFSLIPYYLTVSLILPIVSSQVETEIERLTTSGDINNFLLKPFSLYKFLFFRELGTKIINLIIVVPLFFISIILLNQFFSSAITSLNLILAVIILPISLLSSFSFSYLVGLLCFWLDEFWAIHNLKYVIYVLLGGAVLPFSFFPEKVSALLKLLPFSFMLNWPIRILFGEFNLQSLLVATMWLLVFQISIHLLQRLAISKYSHTAG